MNAEVAVSRTVRCALAVGIIVTLAGSVSAKAARTVRLTITGHHLGQPLEVRTPAALVNVWSGTRAAESLFDFPRPFFGKAAEEPGATLPRYTVSFYADAFTEQPKVRKIYAIRYVPDPQTGGGFVYLPGPRDAEALLNVRAITRPDKDGKWFRASSEWSSVINAHLATAAVSQ